MFLYILISTMLVAISYMVTSIQTLFIFIFSIILYGFLILSNQSPFASNIIIDYFLANSIITFVAIQYQNQIDKNKNLQEKIVRLDTYKSLVLKLNHEIRNPLTLTRGYLEMLKDYDHLLTKELIIKKSEEGIERIDKVLTLISSSIDDDKIEKVLNSKNIYLKDDSNLSK